MNYSGGQTFSGGLGSFRQKSPQASTPGQPPSLDWDSATAGRPGAPGTAPPSLGSWEEGLSRWDFDQPGKWW